MPEYCEVGDIEIEDLAPFEVDGWCGEGGCRVEVERRGAGSGQIEDSAKSIFPRLAILLMSYMVWLYYNPYNPCFTTVRS